MYRHQRMIMIFSVFFFLVLPPAMAADPTPEELADVATPEGVDHEDVQRLFLLISEEVSPSADDIARGDIGPAELISNPDDPYPHTVWPNPNPDGTFDVGDAVLVARRAAGHIVFGNLNGSPAVMLSGDGTLTRFSDFTLSATVSDDQEPGESNIEIWQDDILIEPAGDVLPGGAFSLQVTLGEGDNRFWARATDAYGRMSEFSNTITVTLDSIAPTVQINSPMAGDYLNDSPFRFSGIAGDAHSIAEVLANGISAQLLEDPSVAGQWLWGADVPFSGDGQKTVGVTARDQAGNVSDTAEVQITYDGTDPLVAFDAYPAATNQHQLTLTGMMSDTIGIAGVAINGEAAQLNLANGAWSIVVTITSGDNPFNAEAVDLAGNSGLAGPINIRGDFIPPVLSLLSDEFINDTPYDWVIGISEPVTLISINGSADGAQYNGDSFTIADWDMSNGANTLTLVVSDEAGNEVTETFTVTLDIDPPAIQITEVYRAGAAFLPPGGVDGVITNAAQINVRGTVSDALSGIAGVTVNGYPANVTNGNFELAGLPIIPDNNTITAGATDGAGNGAGHTITVYQDIVGPEITLTGFRRGAHVSGVGAFPAPYNDTAKGNYDGTAGIAVTGTAIDLYTGIVDIQVSWAGQDLDVNYDRGTLDFSFTIPAVGINDSDLFLLSMSAIDELGNINDDFLSALTGYFAARGEVVENGAGLALAPSALGAFTSIIEGEVEDMDGYEMIDETISQYGVTVDITGLAFCDPTSAGKSRYSDPSCAMDGNRCRYCCYQNVTVTMGIIPSGQPYAGSIAITMVIHYLHADMYVHGNLLCWGGSQAYAKAQPATVTMVANFSEDEEGKPTLVALPSTVAVSLGGFAIGLQDCDLLSWMLGLFQGAIEDAMVNEFKNQIDALLAGIGDMLANPLMEEENTEFSVWIGTITNDLDGIKLWLDFEGSPCPDDGALTDKKDDADNFIACDDNAGAQDVYDSPGFLITPNADDYKANLTLIDQYGNPRTVQMAVNDDFANYMIYTEWAQGALDMTIDQEMIGDSLTLDTLTMGNYIPELIDPTRTDVQAIVPTGTPLLIQMHPMLPITINGLDNPTPEADGIRLRAGDIVLSFFADTVGDGSYSTEIMQIALMLDTDASLSYHAAVEAYDADSIALEINNPIILVDLIWAPFVLNEQSLQTSFPTLFDLILPMFIGELGNIELPGNMLRIADVNVIDPESEFINLTGDLVHAISILQPIGSLTGDLPFSGAVTELSGSPLSANMQVFLGEAELGPFSLSATGAAGRMDWSGSIAESLLSNGENRLIVKVTDNNNGATAYQVMKISYDSGTGEIVVTSGASETVGADLLSMFSNLGGCLGCQGGKSDPSMLLLSACFIGLAVLYRRRRISGRGTRRQIRGIFLLLLFLVLLPACNGSDYAEVDQTDGDKTKPDGDIEGNIPDGDQSVTDGDDDKCQGIQCDGDQTDGDGPDGDIDDGDMDPEVPDNDFTGEDVDDDPVVILNMVQIGDETQGFNLDENRSPEGDPDPDNGVYSLGSLANDALEKAVNGGSVLLLLKFIGLNALPAAGESGFVNIKGYLGLDMDNDPANNFDGNQTFGIDPASFDEHGDLLIDFKNVEIRADSDGVVHLKGGPTVFTLTIPLDDQGNAISLTITETQLAAVVQPSALRSGGIELADGLLGGIIPCEILGEPLEALGGIAPLQLLKEYVDIDLNEDGELDHTYDYSDPTGNTDGVSAGIILTAVPAFLDDGSANRAPTISLDEIAETQTEPLLSLSGVFDDPDGECIKAAVTLRANDGEARVADIAPADTGCTFSGEVTLLLGDNTVVATVVDERGADSSDAKSTTLLDNEAPVVEITGPSGPDVSEAVQVLSGAAVDNVGIQGVQIVVDGGETYAVRGSELGPDGEFDIEITLPVLGLNTITAQAKDLAENLSQVAVHQLNLVDVDPPTITLEQVTCGSEMVQPPDDLIVHCPEVVLSGSVEDNFGNGQLLLEAELGSRRLRVPCQYDPLFDTWSVAFTIEPGDNSITIYATDPSQVEGSENYTLSYLDNEAPVIQVTAPETLVHEADQILRFTVEDNVDDAADLSPTVQLNGGEAEAATFDSEAGDFYLAITLQIGANDIHIAVSDLSGNPSEVNGEIVLEDIQAPELEITAPESNSETMDEFVTVVGSATDDIGLATPPVVITVGTDSYDLVLSGEGEFSQKVALELGLNEIRAVATDLGGLSAEKVVRVTRFHPDDPVQLILTADPPTIVAGGGQSQLTAAVLRYAGGPVPAGARVSFAADPNDMGLFSTLSTTTDGAGKATVTFTSGLQSGPIMISASSGEVSDNLTLNIANPTMAMLDICSDGSASFAGVSMSLVNNGPTSTRPPTAEAFEAVSLAYLFHVHNTQDEQPRLFMAGTRIISEAGLIAQFNWPLDDGVPQQEDFAVESAVISDLLGVTQGEVEAFKVCGLDNLLGDLPPVVNINPLPPTVADAQQTISGTVEDANLSTCEGLLIINGDEQPLDVTSGAFSIPVTLQPGANSIVVEATDENDNTGLDSINVFYNAPNDIPKITVTEPGATTSLASEVFKGTVLDDQPLDTLSMRGRVGAGEWVNITVDANTGTWTSDSALDLAMGVNAVKVEATDVLNATGDLIYNVRRIVPINPPVITIDTPEEGQDFNANPVALTGGIVEGGNAAQITLTLTLNGDPHAINWDYFNRRFSVNLNLADGENTIVLSAEDVTGGSDSKTRHITFTAPDNAPVIQITSPAEGANLAASVLEVSGLIQDDRVLSSLISFTVNGVEVNIDDDSGLSSTWSAVITLSEGANVITASAEDIRGNLGEDSVTVTNVAPPTIVLNMIRIGLPSEGFNVDQIGALGDIGPDNALAGLGSIANPMLVDQLMDPEGPLLLILELTGLAELPGPGDPPVTVIINGYIGLDLDNDVSDNFSGNETFGIDPSSFDPDTGLPVIRFEEVQVFNDFGTVRIDTYPDNPAFFSMDIETGGNALTIQVDPAFLDAVLNDDGGGIGMEESLLGGVVPAGLLSMDIDMDGQPINPLAILIRNDPANPIPDVDLNEDGVLATNPETDATPENPDGISVGIVVTGVPCSIQR